MQAQDIKGVKVLISTLDNVDATSLQKAAVSLGGSLGDPSAVILASIPAPGKVSLVAVFSPALVKDRKMNAGKLVGALAKICGGGGGGKPALAQAGGKIVEKLPEALQEAEQQLREMLQ
jgi:alanyl-tRNA synthetase